MGVPGSHKPIQTAVASVAAVQRFQRFAGEPGAPARFAPGGATGPPGTTGEPMAPPIGGKLSEGVSWPVSCCSESSRPGAMYWLSYGQKGML